MTDTAQTPTPHAASPTTSPADAAPAPAAAHVARSATLSEISALLAWAGWVLASLFFFYGFAARVSPSVMVDALMREFALGAAIVGNLSAIYFYVYAVLQIPIGLALDRFGPKRLLTGGAILCAAGCALFALADGTNLAYAGRFLIGAGAASSWIGTLAVIMQNFPARRFALLAGGTQAFGMLGATMGQAPLSLVVDEHGWRASLWTLALFGACLAILLWLVLRDRKVATGARVRIAETMRLALRNRQNWLASLFSMAMIAPMLAFGGLWGVPYLMQVHGMERTAAAGIVSAIFLAWGVGAPLAGAISDRLGTRKRVMVVGATIATLLLCAFPFMDDAPLALLVAIIVATGMSASVYVAGISLVRESNPDAINGTVLGLVNTCVIATGAILQPAIGWILDLNWQGAMEAGARLYPPEAFSWGLAVLPAVAALGTIAAMLSKDTRAG